MKLGYIGVGLMGKPMVLRLLAAGHEVTVWNRSRDKLKPVLEKGAKAAESPAAVARASEIVMMCVTDQKAEEEVLFAPQGIFDSGAKGLLVVDFSSIAPASARSFHDRLKARGIYLVDAPVSGGVPGAEKGTLAIMAGGRAEDIERARPVVMHLAQRFTRMGDAGAGQVAKLCNQVIVGSLFPVIAEAIRLAEAAGVDATRLPEALAGGHPPAAQVTTLVLVRRVAKAVKLPIVASGGAADGAGIAALLALGADAALHLQREGDVAQHIEVRQQGEVLEHHAHLVPAQLDHLALAGG